MKYLIIDNTAIVNQGEAEGWGVNEVMTLVNFEMDLSLLPLTDEPIIYYIPTILDANNPLNYDGANLALRILMYYVRCRRTNVDFVLMGNESERDFMLTFEYPNIMKIPGIHYTRFNKSIVRNYECPQREMLSSEDYLPYFEKLNLKLPSSFKSTHSLTNEWCLYKWNSFMGFGVNTELLKGLYFDYLITIEGFNRVTNEIDSKDLKQSIKNMPTGLRLLVIDDNSGWHDFFEKMFSCCTIDDVHCLGTDFKKMKYEDVEAQIRQEVKSFQPNVIILDFRLMEDKDADIDNTDDISGARILKDVLKVTHDFPSPHYGRQVLMFTATSRIENILTLKGIGADDFILKEKPVEYFGKNNTKELVSRMIESIGNATIRAEYLMPLNFHIEMINQIILESVEKISDDLKNVVKVTFKSIRNITQNNILTKDILKLIYLNLFNIFEEIKRDKNFVDFSNDYTLKIIAHNELKVCENGKSGIYCKSIDDLNFVRSYNLASYKKYCEKGGMLTFAISSLILFRLGYEQVDDTQWNNIRLIRNALAHGNEDALKKKGLSTDDEELKKYSIQMLQLIQDILDPKKIKEIKPY